MNTRNNVASPYYSMFYNPYRRIDTRKVRTNRGRSQFANATGDKSGKDYFNMAFEKTDHSIKGAMLGAAIGLGYALYSHKSYLVYIFLGGAVGFIATNILSKKVFNTKNQLPNG